MYSNEVAVQKKEEVVYNKAYAYRLIDKYAKKYGVSAHIMKRVMDCETGGDYTNPAIQSRVRYSYSDPSRGIYKGQQERSYGFSQIHVPDWNITKEQASNPEFAVEFMARKFAKDKHEYWSCY